MSASSRLAIVTGGSAGIGAATVRRLTQAGIRVVAGALRLDRLRAVTEPVGATAVALDVTDPASVATFFAEVLGDAVSSLSWSTMPAAPSGSTAWRLPATSIGTPCSRPT